MGLWDRFFGRRGQEDSTPAEGPTKGAATPEEALNQYFAAVAAHDLDGILRVLCPERARLYGNFRTMDRQRKSVAAAAMLAAEPVDLPVTLPNYASQYPQRVALRVEYELQLVPPEQRRDPTLREGKQWAYFILVSEGPGKPWLIADWGQ